MRRIIQILIVVLFTVANAQVQPQSKKKQKMNAFEDYIRKTSLSHHYMKIKLSEKINKNVLDIIDTTDELLNLNIDKAGSSPVLLNLTRRYFQPPQDAVRPRGHQDPYSLRARIYELMKQTIYEARDALVIIQELRIKYKEHPLYKMGFVFSKADDQVKMFNALSHKLYQMIHAQRPFYWTRATDMININEMLERTINHWFETDLLVDIIRVNDDNARRMLHNLRNQSELLTWWIDEFYDIYHVRKKQYEEAQKRKRKQLQRELLQAQGKGRTD